MTDAIRLVNPLIPTPGTKTLVSGVFGGVQPLDVVFVLDSPSPDATFCGNLSGLQLLDLCQFHSVRQKREQPAEQQA